MNAFSVPIVSAFTAGVLILFQMALMAAVVIARRRNRQSLGDGGNDDVLRAVRRHGNFAENAALFLAGFTLFELIGGPRRELEIMAAVFAAGRLSHAVGLSLKQTVNPLRVAGVFATVGVGLALGVRLTLLGWSHLAAAG